MSMSMKIIAVFALCWGVTATGTAAAPQNVQRINVSFAQADKNKDGFLDPEELAKAFRGPNAKILADKPGTKEAHPDHLFLDTWDADKDGKISKVEFGKYEAKLAAVAKVAGKKKVNYTRNGRSKYRNAMSHHRTNRGAVANPYQAQARYQQRMIQAQRQAFVNRLRYGAYSPAARGGYRGAIQHGRRR